MQQQQQWQWQELSRARARQWPWICRCCCCCYNLPLTTCPTHQPFTSRCAFSAVLSFLGCRQPISTTIASFPSNGQTQGQNINNNKKAKGQTNQFSNGPMIPNYLYDMHKYLFITLLNKHVSIKICCTISDVTMGGVEKERAAEKFPVLKDRRGRWPPVLDKNPPGE